MKKGILISIVGLLISTTAYGVDTLESLALNYSKNLDISKNISQIEQTQKALKKVVKDKELLNLLKFVSIRLKELKSLKKLPVTKERIKRVSDISRELIEAELYLKKRVKTKQNWNIASL